MISRSYSHLLYMYLIKKSSNYIEDLCVINVREKSIDLTNFSNPRGQHCSNANSKAHKNISQSSKYDNTLVGKGTTTVLSEKSLQTNKTIFGDNF